MSAEWFKIVDIFLQSHLYIYKVRNIEGDRTFVTIQRLSRFLFRQVEK